MLRHTTGPNSRFVSKSPRHVTRNTVPVLVGRTISALDRAELANRFDKRVGIDTSVGGREVLTVNDKVNLVLVHKRLVDDLFYC